MKARVLVLLALLPATVVSVHAQTCSQTALTNTLICTLPQLFGAGGLTLPNPKHKAHFTEASINAFQPLNISIGEALSTLPLGSSGSGTTFAPDAEGHLVPTEDSLGPILTERANVIGRKAFSLGVAYQYFSFDHIDGVRLHDLPAALIHTTDPGEVLTSTSFKNDYITTTNQINISLNQTVLFGVVGLSKRIDASIEIPIQQVHFRVTSAAHIVRTQPCENTQNQTSGAPNYLGGDCTGTLDSTGAGVCGEFHYFTSSANCADIFASVDAAYPSTAPKTDASGIGDVILRGKFLAFNGEKVAASVGLGLRLPSGDAKNFLGSGAYGLAPFGAVTYRARLSPHARLGYQWNSHSVLSGDPTGTSGASTASLPPEFFYSAGADLRVVKRLTVAADLIGGRVLSASHLTLGSAPVLIAGTGTMGSVSTIKSSTESYNSDAIAVGAKVRLMRELVLIGNITTRVDDGGLRANVVPLVGVSYAF